MNEANQETKNNLSIQEKILVILISLVIAYQSAFALYYDWIAECFCSEANELFLQANYAELEKLISERTKEYPNDVYVYWYTAKMEIERGNLEIAEQSLNRVERLNPEWRDKSIKALRKVVEEKKG